jgi:hypothetical protein
MLVQLGSNPVNMEGETSVCSLKGTQGIRTMTKYSIKTLLTSLIFNKFSDFFSMVYVAVVKNQDATRARIGICQWDLLKEVLRIIHNDGHSILQHDHEEIDENASMLLIQGLCHR